MEIITKRPENMPFTEYKAAQRLQRKTISRYTKTGALVFLSKQAIPVIDSLGKTVRLLYTNGNTFKGKVRELKPIYVPKPNPVKLSDLQAAEKQQRQAARMVNYDNIPVVPEQSETLEEKVERKIKRAAELVKMGAYAGLAQLHKKIAKLKKSA